MEMIYEILNENGDVINRIVADAGFVESEYPGAWRVANDEPDLEPITSPITWDTAPTEYFHIHVGSFYDRFGDAKIPVLSSEDRVVQALIADTQPRGYIDLKRPDLPQMLSVLMTKVPVVTQEIADSVLRQETTDEERVTKGLPQPEDD